MLSPQSKAFLTHASNGRHFAHLYKDEEALGESVGLFIETGLRRRAGVMVIARPAHTALLVDHLKQHDWDAEAFETSGQLALVDAGTLLNRIMRNGAPDWRAFRRAIGAIIEGVRSVGAEALRCYGELVDVLWHAGEPGAAIQLEEYWNRLAREYSFSMYCGYHVDGLNRETYSTPLHDIARTHTDILSLDEDDRMHAAVDAASHDILGLPLSLTLSISGREHHSGEHRLPPGLRTILWLKQNMPDTFRKILDRAGRHYRNEVNRQKPGLPGS